MEPEFTAIGHDEVFRFTCDPEVVCFNACCHNLYQVLSPYDILRLKKFFGLSSKAFLDRYTCQAIGPETGLPVVSLKPDAANDMACPFLTPGGCGVYPERPASCRVYPLARAVTRCRETGQKKEHFALLKEAHCRGFDRGCSQSVKGWLADQALEVYNTMNDLLLDVIMLKNKHRPGPLNPAARRSFHMAMYDLDEFRDYLKKGGRSHHTSVDSFEAAGIDIDDDVELLKFGFHWIGKIFGGQKA